MKSFEKKKYVPFMIEKKHGDVFSKHSEIWNRIEEFIGKDSDFGVIQNDKFISAKIKS